MRYPLADLAAAAHLSCLDYLGDVPWDEHPVANKCYLWLKIPPRSFRPLLADHWPGTKPPAHYANLDFLELCQSRAAFVMARLGLAIHEFRCATSSGRRQTRGSQGQALG